MAVSGDILWILLSGMEWGELPTSQDWLSAISSQANPLPVGCGDLSVLDWNVPVIGTYLLLALAVVLADI
jgi:hypothetical protein